MSTQFCLAYLVLFVMQACQTSQPTFEKVQLPARLSELFGSCSGDGATRIHLHEGDLMSQSVVVDWLVTDEAGWLAEAMTPLGSTLFKVRYEAAIKSLVAEGRPLSDWTLGVSESGYLTVEGYEVRLRLDEIPCFLRNQFPQSWLERVVSTSISSDTMRLIVWQSDRQLKITLNLKEPQNQHCAILQWSSFLGMVTRSMKICREESGMVFSGWEDAQLKLEYLEGL